MKMKAHSLDKKKDQQSANPCVFKIIFAYYFSP